MPHLTITFRRCRSDTEVQLCMKRLLHREVSHNSFPQVLRIIVIFENLFSQGSVVTQLRCGGIFSNRFITLFSTEFDNEKF